LLLVIGLGVGGRKNRFFGVLPELVCFRHGTLNSAPTRPNVRLPP
jgi:hypothetical protein